MYHEITVTDAAVSNKSEPVADTHRNSSLLVWNDFEDPIQSVSLKRAKVRIFVIVISKYYKIYILI